MNIVSLKDITAKGANFILSKYLPIPENAVTLLSALGGTGKTRLSLIMASKFISETKGDYNVSLWLTEDYQGQVREIFDNMDNLISLSIQRIANRNRQ